MAKQKPRKTKTAKKTTKAAAKKARAATIPRYACTRTADDAQCIRYEYNPETRQYDRNRTIVSCDTCTNFLD